ncbi:MAG TPA: UDP-N-acetylmuramate dehydrogenase [Gammaproteobacteria bacterium]|jgi:UDP-N-acetylmuramate dehydrogenase
MSEKPPVPHVLINESLRRYTSWRVGGPADLLCRPASLEELQAFLASVPAEMPVTWLGLGSNVLVRDGGIRGAVVCTSGLPRVIERLDAGMDARGRATQGAVADAGTDARGRATQGAVADAGRVRAGAGVPCATLARRCVRWKLGPAAFFAGIPGSLGGALAMNAGAYGAETWERVESVTTIDRSGVLRERRRAEFDIGYRHVAGAPGEWFVGAVLAFEANRVGEALVMKELLAARSAAQPLGRPNAGSVFRNPAGDYAGRLIEAAGLKGQRRGGAVVSAKHANFIINEGGATAADVEGLIETVRAAVKEQTGVLLELEVRVLGERGGAQS